MSNQVEAKVDPEARLTPEQRAELEQQFKKIIRLKPMMDKQEEPILAVALNLTGVLLMLGTIHRGIVFAGNALTFEEERGETPEAEMTAKKASAGMARSQAHAFDEGAKAFLLANPKLVKENPAAQRMLKEVLGHVGPPEEVSQ